MNDAIDKIENGFLALYNAQPRESYLRILKDFNVPYYGYATEFLKKRNLIEPDGQSFKWVGDMPRRTLCALFYEEAKTFSASQKPAAKNRAGSKADTPAEQPQKANKAKREPRPEPEPEVLQPDWKDYPVPANTRRSDLERGLAIMTYAMRAGVKDPISFTLDLMDDPRI